MSGRYYFRGASYCHSYCSQNESTVEIDKKHLKANVDQSTIHSVGPVNQLNVHSSAKTSVSVVGLEQEGLSLIARLTRCAHKVIAVDKKRSFVKSICSAYLPAIAEPVRGFLERARNSQGLSATTDLYTAVKCSRICVVTDSILQTNNLADYNSGYSMSSAIAEIAMALKSIEKYHTILLYGEFDLTLIKNTYIPIIEQTSQKKLGTDFGICCVMEKLADDMRVDSLFVKAFDKNSELTIRRLYKGMTVKSKCFDFTDAI